ncbi:MAG: nucleotidyltransferase domain-containing protein [Candidatus Eremiobacteraeota bacterium]|nr:nucleotidyltransferase domain-containing protein [Candidatus Eremiobacteraeota bacterium]
MEALKLSPSEKDALRQFKTRAESSLGGHLVKILLFGSKARGDASEESDIDLMVVLNDDDPALEDLILDIAYEVNLAHEFYLSPKVITLKSLEDRTWRATPFIKAIEKESIEL